MEKETAFNFNIPLQMLEKGEDGDWYVEGIAATENKDFQGEILKIDGLDISTLSKNGFFNEDHKKGFQHILGKIEHAEKRESEEVGKHLYVKGKLFKTQPGAQACYNIMKELKDSDKQMQLSVEGKILKREGKDKKTITKAKVEHVALTLNPINDHTFATFLKSFGDGGFSEVNEDVGQEPTDGQTTSSQPSEMVDVKLNKSTYDKLINFIDDKKTFKEHIYDLVKGMSPEERDGVFKVLVKAKQELEKAKYIKRTGTPGSYKYEYKEGAPRKMHGSELTDKLGEAFNSKKTGFTPKENENWAFTYLTEGKDHTNALIDVSGERKGIDTSHIKKIYDDFHKEHGHLISYFHDNEKEESVNVDSKNKIVKKAEGAGLTATHSYATQLPQERTGGDVMTQESLDSKKKKIKKVVTEVKKAYPDVDLKTIFNKVLEKLS